VEPLVSGAISKWSRKNPGYIDRQLFGQAMMDILKISPEVSKAASGPNAPLGKPTVKALTDAVDGVLKAAPDDQLKTFFHGVIERSVGDPDKIKAELVAWFDNAMDRVSGWYKRWTQLISFIVALILSVVLNIDTTKKSRGAVDAAQARSRVDQEFATRRCFSPPARRRHRVGRGYGK